MGGYTLPNTEANKGASTMRVTQLPQDGAVGGRWVDPKHVLVLWDIRRGLRPLTMDEAFGGGGLIWAVTIRQDIRPLRTIWATCFKGTPNVALPSGFTIKATQKGYNGKKRRAAVGLYWLFCWIFGR